MTRLLINLFVKRKKLTGKKERERYGVLSGFTGIVCNIMLCLAKFAIGTLANSVSITADAVNNLSDAGSSVVTIAGTKLSNKPIDKEHPFGHGRIEYISAMVVSFFIFIMGFELGKASVTKIIHPEEVKFSIWSVVALGLAICVKLWMAFFNNVLYKETENINMKAVRQDSLNDCLATAATIAAMLISSLTSFKRADGIIGIAVAVVIFISGIDILKDILGPLLGQAPEQEIVKGIEKILLDKEQIVGVHDLIVHDYGPGRIIASVHAEVPSDVDIIQIHDIIDNAEKEISEQMNIAICIHMDPIELNNEEVSKYRELTQKVIKEYNSGFMFHDFRMVQGETNVNLIFDLVVPHDIDKAGGIRTVKDLQDELRKTDSRINLVVTVEHSFV